MGSKAISRSSSDVIVRSPSVTCEESVGEDGDVGGAGDRGERSGLLRRRASWAKFCCILRDISSMVRSSFDRSSKWVEKGFDGCDIDGRMDTDGEDAVEGVWRVTWPAASLISLSGDSG